MTTTIELRSKAILSEMTLDEKLAQLGSYWFYELQTGGQIDHEKVAHKLKHGIGQITRVAGASTLSPIDAAKTANYLQKFLMDGTRLGIPAILHEECCSGAMVLGGTNFPQILGLAATFQPELARLMTGIIRRQLLAIGARQGLAPVLDIARDPRWGRVEETFGEDPTLASQFGVAYVQGLQGESLAEGVMATGKHFIGHSFSQAGLNCGPVHIGWRELYDVCLMPFQAVIREAGLQSIMNSYPELDGEVVAASRRILTDILRHELGFDGLLVSDYEAVLMLHNFHYIAASRSSAAGLAIQAGIDVELPTVNCYGDPLRLGLESGEINLEFVDQSVMRHLTKKLELGLFDNPFVDEGKVFEVFENDENKTLARDIARQSIVLLKNDGILPLKKTGSKIAVIGPNANDPRTMLGDYSYPAMNELMDFQKRFESSTIGMESRQSVLECIRSAVPGDTEVLFAQGCDHLSDNRDGFNDAIKAAEQSDVVVLVLGDRSGFTLECTTGETRDSASLRLPGGQDELAKVVIESGKPVVVVLVNGRPYAIPWLAENANAILEAWLPGDEGGYAIADVLFGDANPGGKLPITFPRGVGQVPVFYSSPPSGKSSHWYKDYVDDKVSPLFPFGHGMSYTSFVYENLSIDRKTVAPGESVGISLNVRNVGGMAGEEVVQLYIRDEYASVPRPGKELKGFLRISLLPGEVKSITFHLNTDQLAFYTKELELVLEPGKISVMVGSSSEDIRLCGEFEVAGPEKRLVTERVFNCPVEVG